MEKDKYITLIYKRLKGEANQAEQALLDDWLSLSEDNKKLFRQIEREWQLSANYTPVIDIDEEKDFKTLLLRIQKEKEKQKHDARIIPSKPLKRWLTWAVAASITLVCGLWLLNNYIAPNDMLLVQTGAGEKKELVLPDGSHVWLNEHSNFSYPELFDGTARTVRLEGEGYFEVTNKKKVPFTIETKEANISVLGTAFNLRAYTGEMKVTVVVDEGKVKLDPKTSHQSLVISKNEKGIFDVNNQLIQVVKADNSNDSFWKTGTLVYKNTPLVKVAADLEKYFNVLIDITDEKMLACPVTGRFPNATIQNILRDISVSFKMTVKQINNRSYQLDNGVCQ